MKYRVAWMVYRRRIGVGVGGSGEYWWVPIMRQRVFEDEDSALRHCRDVIAMQLPMSPANPTIYLEDK